MHIIAAKAVAFREALEPSFAAYQKRIVANAKALADGLLRRGIRLVSGGTDTHLMLIDLRETGVTGKTMQLRLDEVNITCNKNGIPYDPEKPFVTSGIRLGTPAVPTRGMNEQDMDEIADLIHLALTGYDTAQDEIRTRVAALCARYPLYAGL
jgi:glycine hydroxymethyltransferase